jgi:hypothetical protein
VTDPADPFAELLAELSDGARWKLARASGWDDFVDRLARMLPDLPLRRRQALVMLLVALTEGSLDPERLSDWLGEHEASSDVGLEKFIRWLRQFRPRDDLDPV